MSTLREVIRDLDTLTESHVIYAVPPWTRDSVAYIDTIDPETDDGRYSKEFMALGAAYFLEPSIAREFLDGWFGMGPQARSTEALDRLIVYATNDA